MNIQKKPSSHNWGPSKIVGTEVTRKCAKDVGTARDRSLVFLQDTTSGTKTAGVFRRTVDKLRQKGGGERSIGGRHFLGLLPNFAHQRKHIIVGIAEKSHPELVIGEFRDKVRF